MGKHSKSNLVYSTDGGRLCPQCHRPVASCVCKKDKPAAAGDGIVRLRRETKGRGGKAVTLITGLCLAQGDMRELTTVAYCSERNVPFFVHENWRWQSPLRAISEDLQHGKIGKPFRCRIDMISGFDVFANQPNFRTDERFIISDLGCHLLDLARSYFGETESLYCQTSRVHHDIVGEDVATIQLTMTSGVLVTINMAYAETPLERECFPETLLFIEGSEGSITLEPGCQIRRTTRHGTTAKEVRPPLYPWVEPAYAVVQSSIVPCLENLLSGTRGQSAETTAADNLNTMRLVFAAYDSADQNQVIRLGMPST
jgi:predicted dehydrogenase